MIGLRRAFSLCGRYILDISSMVPFHNKALYPLYHSTINYPLRAFNRNIFPNIEDPEGPEVLSQVPPSEASATADAQEFLNEVREATTRESEYINDLSSISDLNSSILNSRIPIILHFTANWCNPCQKLNPRLNSHVLENIPKLRLIRVDIDEFGSLGTQMQVRTLPTLFLIGEGGQVTERIVGLPDDQKLGEFIDTGLLMYSLAHDESVLKLLIQDASSDIENKEYGNAIEKLKKGYGYKQWRDRFGADILLLLAQGYLGSGNWGQAKQEINKLKDLHKGDINNRADIVHLLGELEEQLSIMQSEEVDEELLELKRKLHIDSKNLELRYSLAKYLVEKDKLDEAIDHSLAIITIDRNWNNAKAKHLLLSIFEMLGANSHLVITGRKRLAKILY